MFRKAGIGFAALAMLAPGIASALGVGDYQLKSYLNQPLSMTVELTETGDLTAEEILVSLAGQKEFDNAGIDRVFFLSDLEFEVEVREDGSGLLTIKSIQPVREPFLDFLVEVLWPQGRMLREYTVLLDPPTYEDTTAVAPAAAEPAAEAPPEPVVETQPVPATSVAPAPEPVQSVSAPAAEPVVASGSYSGPRDEYVVQAQDTMWRIALNTRPAGSISVQQMMLSIQELNPDAFIDGNVNLVREGTVLRLPTEQEVRNISARQALGEVAEQNRQWREKLKARGIPVPGPGQLDGRKGAAGDGSTVVSSEGQVKLVSADAATDAQSGSGSGKSGAGDSAALENELVIRDENIDRLKRENGELSSRLTDLKGQVDTSEKLLQLRNDQIAQLQEQLRKLQEQQGIEPDAPLVSDAELAGQVSGETGEAGSAAAAIDGGAATAGGATAAAGTTGSDGGFTAQSGAGAGAGGFTPQSEGGTGTGGFTPQGGDAAAGGGEIGSAGGATGEAGLSNEELLATEGGSTLGEVQGMMTSSGEPGSMPTDVDLGMQAAQGDGPTLQISPGDMPKIQIAPPKPKDGAAGAAGAEGADGAPVVVEEEGGLLTILKEQAMLIIGGLLLLVVIFVAMVVVRNRQKAKAASDQAMAAMDQSEDDFFVDNIEDDEVAGTFESDEEPAADDAPAAAQDPLDEVEVYTAYGRHAEAVTFLQNAISKEPSRSDLKVRLLELMVEMNDAPGFEREAQSFSGDATVAARADQLRAKMGGGAAESEPDLDDLAMDLSDDLGAGGAADDDLDLDLGGGDDDATLVLDAADLDAGEESLDDLDLDLSTADESAGDDDGLDLDLSLDDDAGATADEGDELSLDIGGEEEAAGDDLGDLEFSLDDDDAGAGDDDLTLSLDDDAAADDAGDDLTLSLDAEPSLDLAGDNSAEDELSLDLDEDISLDDASDEFQQAAETPPTEDELDLSLDDLDGDVTATDESALDLSLDEDDSPTEVGMSAVSDDDLADAGDGSTVQRGAMDADLSLDDIGGGESTAMREALPEAGLDDDDDFDFLGDTDENATKLDLAKAYIDMGDNEGARDILNEVISEGSPEQQQEARDLLAQVG